MLVPVNNRIRQHLQPDAVDIARSRSGACAAVT
jgi:hypothetical protein